MSLRGDRIQRLFKSLDASGDGSIDVDEFITFVRVCQKHTVDRKQAAKMLSFKDRGEKDGQLSLAEFTEACDGIDDAKLVAWTKELKAGAVAMAKAKKAKEIAAIAVVPWKQLSDLVWSVADSNGNGRLLKSEIKNSPLAGFGVYFSQMDHQQAKQQLCALFSEDWEKTEGVSPNTEGVVTKKEWDSWMTNHAAFETERKGANGMALWLAGIAWQADLDTSALVAKCCAKKETKVCAASSCKAGCPFSILKLSHTSILMFALGFGTAYAMGVFGSKKK